MGLLSIRLALAIAAIAPNHALAMPYQHHPSIISDNVGTKRTPQVNRTGIWTTLNCSDPAVLDNLNIPPSERWLRLDAPTALKDLVDYWTKVDKPSTEIQFLQSISSGMHDVENMRCDLIADSSCSAPILCDGFQNKPDTGPAAFLIHNSFVNIHNIFARFNDDLKTAASLKVIPALDHFIDVFAPIPPKDPNDKWTQIFIDMIVMGATAGFGKTITGALSALPEFSKSNSDVTKAAVKTLMGGATDKIKELRDKKGLPDWDVKKQHELKASISAGFLTWWQMAAQSLAKLFDGTPETIGVLSNLVDKGQMLSGRSANSLQKNKGDVEWVNDFIGAMFAFAVPQAWRASGRQAFVLDSGAACDKELPSNTFITPDTAKRSRACIDGKLYFLVMPPSEPSEKCVQRGGGCKKTGCLPDVCHPNQFVTPPGIDALTGNDADFGNATVAMIISGSLKTFKANGNKNGGGLLKVDDVGSVTDLAEGKLDTTGFFNLPVCSGEVAHKRWGSAPSTEDNWPC